LHPILRWREQHRTKPNADRIDAPLDLMHLRSQRRNTIRVRRMRSRSFRVPSQENDEHHRHNRHEQTKPDGQALTDAQIRYEFHW
jgi:hypothetical protein